MDGVKEEKEDRLEDKGEGGGMCVCLLPLFIQETRSTSSPVPFIFLSEVGVNIPRNIVVY